MHIPWISHGCPIRRACHCRSSKLLAAASWGWLCHRRRMRRDAATAAMHRRGNVGVGRRRPRALVDGVWRQRRRPGPWRRCASAGGWRQRPAPWRQRWHCRLPSFTHCLVVLHGNMWFCPLASRWRCRARCCCLNSWSYLPSYFPR